MVWLRRKGLGGYRLDSARQGMAGGLLYSHGMWWLFIRANRGLCIQSGFDLGFEVFAHQSQDAVITMKMGTRLVDETFVPIWRSS
jgi:hypothetical protein